MGMDVNMNMDVTERLNLTPPESPPKQKKMGCLGLIGRFLMVLIALVLGVVIGFGSMLIYLGNTKPNAPTPPVPFTNDAIQVQMNPTYLSQWLNKQSTLPGDVSNLQIQTSHDANQPLVVTGDQKIIVLFFPVTRKFTVVLQPVVKDCQLTMRLIRADSDNLPVTPFVTSLETSFNAMLKVNLTRFPEGFTYCTTSVKTENDGISVSYSAQPQ